MDGETLVATKGNDFHPAGKSRLLHAGDRVRVVTSQTDWPSYDGHTSGNRYTPLLQIDKTNVARLAPRWIGEVRSTI